MELDRRFLFYARLKMASFISIHGAYLHNLKKVHAKFKLNAINVVCGPSGCGKSSLVLDTLHGESRRRYLESLSPFALRVLGGNPYIPIESATGLLPSIAISATRGEASEKSKAYTIANIDEALHRIWAHLAKPTCPTCDKPMQSFTREEIITQIANLPVGSRLQFLAPIETKQKKIDSLASVFLAQGYTRALVDQQNISLADLSESEKELIPQKFFLVIDRIIIRENTRTRIAEATDACLKITHTLLAVHFDDRMLFYSTEPWCPEHQIQTAPLQAASFSPFKEESKSKSVQNSSFKGLLWKDLIQQNFESIAQTLNSLLSSDIPAYLEPTAQQLTQKVQAVIQLGLHYLSLDRAGNTLSGGELQRLRLSTIATGYLNGMLICLDEPASGLHSHDIQKLWKVFTEIKNAGNTLVLIEHHPDIIHKADYLIEMGPKAGFEGGEILFEGPAKTVLENPRSPTGLWLKKLKEKPVQKDIKFKKTHTIKNFHIYDMLPVSDFIPIHAFTVITGESGSGKSSLIFQYIIPKFEKGGFKNLGVEAISFLSTGNFQGSRRSTVASATQILTPLRELFARLPESKIRGYTSAHFALHASGGRCNTCKGEGSLLDPLGYQETPCSVCLGKRYKDEILEIRFKTHSFSDILSLSIQEAAILFEDFPHIAQKLKPLLKTGLSYLKLGQFTSQLSGGERARLRLSIHLSKASAPHTLFIFDEPARGLHETDIHLMLLIIEELQKNGHTIIAIEQSKDFLQKADHIIELQRRSQ